jgi:hypothetical protein
MASRRMVFALASLVLILGLVMVARPKQATSAFLGGARRWLSEQYVETYATSVRVVGVGWVIFGFVLLALALRDVLRG